MDGLNLLPWREQRREEQKRQFFIILITSLLITTLLIMLAHTLIARKIEYQKTINRTLQTEITTMNQQIREVNELKQKRGAMIHRLKLIQQLQATRPLTVKLYDHLVRIVPPGVFLNHVKRKDYQVTLDGKAESNSRISSLMRNIEKSPWFSSPVLNEIKTDNKNSIYHRDFILKFNLIKNM